MLNDVLIFKFSYVCLNVFTLWTIIIEYSLLQFQTIKYKHFLFAQQISKKHWLSRDDTLEDYFWWHECSFGNLNAWWRIPNRIPKFPQIFFLSHSLFLQKFLSWCESKDVLVIVFLNFHTLIKAKYDYKIYIMKWLNV